MFPSQEIIISFICLAFALYGFTVDKKEEYKPYVNGFSSVLLAIAAFFSYRHYALQLHKLEVEKQFSQLLKLD